MKLPTIDVRKWSVKQITGVVLSTILLFSMIFWAISGYRFTSNYDTNWVSAKGNSVVDKEIINEFMISISNAGDAVAKNPYAILNQLQGVIYSKTFELLLYVEAKKLGLKTDDISIKKILKQNDFLLNDDETIDENKLMSYISSIYPNVDSFLTYLKRQYLANILLYGVTPLIKEPKAITYIESFANNYKETIEYFEITEENIKPITQKPSKEELQVILDANANLFKVPEQKDLEVLTINYTAKKINIKESELKEFYNQHLERYYTKELRSIKHIILDTEKEAKKVYKSISNVDNLPEEYIFIDVANIPQATLEPEMNKVIFNAELNKVNKPVETSFGWDIIIVTNISPKKPKDFAKVRSEILSELRSIKEIENINEFSDNLINTVDNTENLQSLAKKSYITYKKLNKVDVNNLMFNKFFEKEESLIEITTGLVNQNEVSSLVESNKVDNKYYIVKLNEVYPEKLQSLKVATPSLTVLWYNEKVNQSKQLMAAKVLSDLQEKGKFNVAKNKVKTTVVSFQNIQGHSVLDATTAQSAILQDDNTTEYFIGKSKNQNPIVIKKGNKKLKVNSINKQLWDNPKKEEIDMINYYNSLQTSNNMMSIYFNYLYEHLNAKVSTKSIQSYQNKLFGIED